MRDIYNEEVECQGCRAAGLDKVAIVDMLLDRCAKARVQLFSSFSQMPWK